MMILIGYENYVQSDSILAVVDPNSAPIKKFRREAAEKGLVIDSTCGRKTRSVIVLSTSHLVLCPLAPSTLSIRLNSAKKNLYRKSGSVFLEQTLGEDAKSTV